MNKSLILNLMKEHRHYVFIQVIVWALAALFDAVLLGDGEMLNIVYLFSGGVLVSFFALYFMNDYVDKDKHFSYAALPMSKKKLWMHYAVSGLILIYVPLIIESLLTWIINNGDNGEMYFNLLVVGIFYYFQAMLCATISGNKIGRVILFLGMSFIPVIFYAIFFSFVSLLVPAVSFEFSSQIACRLCPLFACMMDQYSNDIMYPWYLYSVSLGNCVPNLIYILVMAVLSRYTFIHYPIKNDNKLIVYPKLNEVVKYILIITISLVLSAGIVLMLPDLVNHYGFADMLKIGVLLVAVTLLVGFFMELVLNQEKRYQHLAAYCLASAVIFAGMLVYARMDYCAYVDEVLKECNNVQLYRESGCVEMYCVKLNKLDDIKKLVTNYDALVYAKTGSNQSYSLCFDGDKQFTVNLDEADVKKYQDNLKDILINATKSPEFIFAENGEALLDANEVQQLCEYSMNHHDLTDYNVFMTSNGDYENFNTYEDYTASVSAIERCKLFDKYINSSLFSNELKIEMMKQDVTDYSIDNYEVSDIDGYTVTLNMNVYNNLGGNQGIYKVKTIVNLKTETVSFEVENND